MEERKNIKKDFKKWRREKKEKEKNKGRENIGLKKKKNEIEKETGTCPDNIITVGIQISVKITFTYI